MLGSMVAPVGVAVQVTPAVPAAPATTADMLMDVPWLIVAVFGETVTSEYREMTMNPLSCAVVQISPEVSPRSCGKLGWEVAQS